MAVDEGHPSALAAPGGSQSTLLDLSVPLEAAMGDQPNALPASGGGHGGRLTSGHHWKPTPKLWLPVEAARAPYLRLWPPVEAVMAANNHLAVAGNRPNALAASGGSQGTLPDLSLPLEAAMGDQPTALAASGGSQSTLPTCSGRQWWRLWRLTDIWPSLEADPHALAASGGSQSTLPTCSGRQWRRQ